MLKEKLDFSSSKIEQLNESEHFLIVPIKEGLKTEKKLDKKSVLNLVLVLDKNEAIKRGSIALYTSNADQAINKLPENTFSKIFNHQAVDCNGQFKFLSVSGGWIYQLAFEDGQLKSYGQVQQKNSEAGRLNAMCRDWYLHTIYYVNGVVVDETWEYIGTTCDSDGCNSPDYMSLCADDGAGGNEIEYEVEVVKGADYEWTVQNIPEAFGSGWLRQTNHLVARFNNKNASKNRFVGGSTSNIVLVGSSWGQNGNVAYSNTLSNVTVNSNTQATLASSGTIRFSNNVTFNYSGSKTISLSDCSWY